MLQWTITWGGAGERWNRALLASRSPNFSMSIWSAHYCPGQLLWHYQITLLFSSSYSYLVSDKTQECSLPKSTTLEKHNLALRNHENKKYSKIGIVGKNQLWGVLLLFQDMKTTVLATTEKCRIPSWLQDGSHIIISFLQSLEHSVGYFFSPVRKWKLKIPRSANGKVRELSFTTFHAAKTSWVLCQPVLSDCQCLW